MINAYIFWIGLDYILQEEIILINFNLLLFYLFWLFFNISYYALLYLIIHLLVVLLSIYWLMYINFNRINITLTVWINNT